jgi:hypothetical protein
MFFVFFLFTDSEVIKEVFREEPLSSGEEVNRLENRDVITAVPVITDSPVDISISPVGQLLPEVVHPISPKVDERSEVRPFVSEVEAVLLPNLAGEVIPAVTFPVSAGTSSRPCRTCRPLQNQDDPLEAVYPFQ